MHGTPAEVAMVSEGWFFTMKRYCILHDRGAEDNRLYIVAGHIQVRSRVTQQASLLFNFNTPHYRGSGQERNGLTDSRLDASKLLVYILSSIFKGIKKLVSSTTTNVQRS